MKLQFLHLIYMYVKHFTQYISNIEAWRLEGETRSFENTLPGKKSINLKTGIDQNITNKTLRTLTKRDAETLQTEGPKYNSDTRTKYITKE